MKKIIITLLSCTLLLCGYTQNNIVAPEGNHVLDTEIRGNIEIEWSQVWDDLDAQFLNKKLYPSNESINGNITDEENKIDLVLLANEEIIKKQASEYAMAVLKGLNDSVATQDFSFNFSDEELYGDSVSNNDVNVLVAPALPFEDPPTHVLEDAIKVDEEHGLVGMPVAE